MKIAADLDVSGRWSVVCDNQPRPFSAFLIGEAKDIIPDRCTESNGFFSFPVDSLMGADGAAGTLKGCRPVGRFCRVLYEHRETAGPAR